MATVVLDLFKAALQEIGALAADETPSGSDTQLCLKTLNMMLGAWSADGLRVRGTVSENFSLVANTRTYTIGTSGVFVTETPLSIVSAFVRDTDNNGDAPVDIISADIYNGYGNKMYATGRPEAINFDSGLTQQSTRLGTISVFPIPNKAYTLFFESLKVLTEITSTGATVTFEAPYFEAIVYNLAPRLWRKFHDGGAPIPGDILRMAADSLAVIERMNTVTPVADMNIPGVGGGFNIYTGEQN